VKDVHGAIVMLDEKLTEAWNSYIEKLMNEEFDWDKNNLEDVNQSCQWSM